MIGGEVVQIVEIGSFKAVEVLDTVTFERCWRRIGSGIGVRIKDRLWWQSNEGYVSFHGIDDENHIPVGSCVDSDNPLVNKL